MAQPTGILVIGGLVKSMPKWGNVVATLGVVDADPGDSFTFALTDDISGFFEIVTSSIYMPQLYDRVLPSHNVPTLIGFSHCCCLLPTAHSIGCAAGCEIIRG